MELEKRLNKTLSNNELLTKNDNITHERSMSSKSYFDRSDNCFVDDSCKTYNTKKISKKQEVQKMRNCFVKLQKLSGVVRVSNSWVPLSRFEKEWVSSVNYKSSESISMKRVVTKANEASIATKKLKRTDVKQNVRSETKINKNHTNVNKQLKNVMKNVRNKATKAPIDPISHTQTYEGQKVMITCFVKLSKLNGSVKISNNNFWVPPFSCVSKSMNVESIVPKSSKTSMNKTPMSERQQLALIKKLERAEAATITQNVESKTKIKKQIKNVNKQLTNVNKQLKQMNKQIINVNKRLAKVKKSKSQNFDLKKCTVKIKKLDMSKYPQNKVKTVFSSVGHTKKFKCQDCNFSTNFKEILKNHQSICNSNSEQFSCKLCDFKTSASRILRRHIELHHETYLKKDEDSDTEIEPGQIVFSCPVCSRHFSKKSKFLRHFESKTRSKTPTKCALADEKQALIQYQSLSNSSRTTELIANKTKKLPVPTKAGFKGFYHYDSHDLRNST